MFRRYLITILLITFLVGCTSQNSQRINENQGQNVTSEGIRITPDVVYGHKLGMALTFDVYEPKNHNGAGVIFINSGGYRSIRHFHKLTTEGYRMLTDEELASMQPPIENRFRPMLNKGFTVFVVNHGSRPKFRMDEIVKDLRIAVRYIRYYAANYGVDAERLGIMGGSSGGHLALLIGLTAEIGIPEANEEFEKGNGRVAAIAAACPPTDLIMHFKSKLAKPRPANMPKSDDFIVMTDEEYKEYSPINHATPDDPPTLIVHGDQDKIVPFIEVESMYQALLREGVESKFVEIPGAGHGFEGKASDQLSIELINWFEEHLLKK